jgi:hypothetical protein
MSKLFLLKYRLNSVVPSAATCHVEFDKSQLYQNQTVSCFSSSVAETIASTLPDLISGSPQPVKYLPFFSISQVPNFSRTSLYLTTL